MVAQSLIALLFLLCLAQSTSPISTALPGCRTACGNLTLPYPFGMEEDCYMLGFKMTCNDTFYDPPKLFMGSGNIEITQVTLDNVFMEGLIARDCYGELPTSSHVWTNIENTPYTLSYARNRFTAIGCDTLALLYRATLVDFTSGCISLCADDDSVANGTCAGSGCCQTTIPMGMKRFDALLGSVQNHTTTKSFSPCSFAFLIDQEQFEFSVPDFIRFRSRSTVPIVLDWAVGNQTCGDANKSGSMICGPNSGCVDSDNGPGYKCRCNQGYHGNPYLDVGCEGRHFIEHLVFSC